MEADDVAYTADKFAVVGFRIFLICFFIFVISGLTFMLLSDIDKTQSELLENVLKEIQTCKMQYEANLCGQETQPRILDAFCDKTAK